MKDDQGTKTSALIVDRKLYPPEAPKKNNGNGSGKFRKKGKKSNTNVTAADTASIDGSTPAASNQEVHHVDDEKRSFHETLDVERGPVTDVEKQDVEEAVEEPRDPNIVDWDGPDDPENPLNWTKKKKVSATISIALITLLTYDSLKRAITSSRLTNNL